MTKKETTYPTVTSEIFYNTDLSLKQAQHTQPFIKATISNQKSLA